MPRQSPTVVRSRLVLLLAIGVVAALAAPARATWSIIIIDTETKEVAIGSATCLTDFDLERWTPVLVVGVGGATAQSYVDQSGANRKRIWDGFHKGTAPAEILRILGRNDSSHQTRQYGIVDTLGRAVTFTGTGAGAWAGGLVGQTGTLVYAIQGNVLTGDPVIKEAEQALLDTEGDLPEKLMAAMEAARSMGGDGRCSCNPNDPDGCGSPPPHFRKSAHVGYMIVARLGDTDGTCNSSVGCASGDYFLDFNIAFKRDGDEDPVILMRRQFETWRDKLRGHADGIQSVVDVSPAQLPPDGSSTATMTITLVDWTGSALSSGGAKVTVAHEDGSAGITSIGQAVDNGDGTYTVPLTAGDQVGLDIYRVTVEDGGRPVQLSPAPSLVNRRLDFVYPDGRPAFVLPDGGTRMRVQVLPVGSSTPGDKLDLVIVQDGGNVTVPADRVGDGRFDATFPAATCGGPVRYFVQANTAAGEPATDPLLAPAAVFEATAGALRRVPIDDNFEEDLGWTPENLGATDGDWQRGVPVNDSGSSYDPYYDSDYSGKCWLTANRRGISDVDKGAVRLTSPQIDMSDGVAEIRYDYYLYLTNTDGSDKLLVEINSRDGEGDWLELARHDKNGGNDWHRVVIDQAALDALGVEQTATMRVRFTANDDAPESTVEAGLDAFRVTVIPCVPPFPRGDLNCDGAVDFADIDAFVLALTGESDYRAQYPACYSILADINCDRRIDFADIDAFVTCLVEGSCPNCP